MVKQEIHNDNGSTAFTLNVSDYVKKAYEEEYNATCSRVGETMAFGRPLPRGGNVEQMQGKAPQGLHLSSRHVHQQHRKPGPQQGKGHRSPHGR